METVVTHQMLEEAKQKLPNAITYSENHFEIPIPDRVPVTLEEVLKVPPKMGTRPKVMLFEKARLMDGCVKWVYKGLVQW